MYNPLHQPIAYHGRAFAAYVDLEHTDNLGPLEIRKPSRIPPPGTETGGEVDEALSMFWYVDLLNYDYQKGRCVHNTDWGIHVNADVLVEWTAGIATAMERDGLPNAPELALDLAFIFGFDHCFFHHCVDAQVSFHMLRKEAAGEEISPLRQNYAVACERLHIAKQYPQWWLVVEEALANAHVARDPTRLGGLREAFIRYGMLPQPNDATRGPWALWEQVSMDEQAFAALSHMIWLQHLTGDMDPLGLLSSLENDIDYLIVDIPAGASDSALFFVNAADLALIILVAEPTSFLDAYALVKAAHLENGVTDFAVMVNMADNAKTAETNFNKFRDITMRFLDIKLHYVGMVPQSPVIRRSIVQRKPISISQPKSPLAKTYETLALKMMKTSHSRHDGVKFFNGAQK